MHPSRVISAFTLVSALMCAHGPTALRAQSDENAPAPLVARASGPERRGETITATAVVSETVDEIMGRAAEVPVLLERPSDERARATGARKLANPDAPAVASWPARAAADVEGAAPPPLLERAPQVPGANFAAITMAEAAAFPPDIAGDVGPSQVLVATNGRIKVFDKAGNLGPLNTTTDAFFASVRTTTTAQPRIRYDRLSGRWFVVMLTRECPENNVLIAVSSGPVISGQSSFTFFRFLGEVGRRLDDPSLGVDRHALYLGGQMYNCGGQYANASAFIIRKSDLLAGTLTVTAFRDLQSGTPQSGIFAPQGADNDDPAATEGYFVGTDNAVLSRLEIVRITNPGGIPTASALALNVPITAFPINQPQPGGPTLSALDDRPFAAAVHRNKVTNTVSLWTAHAIQVTSGGVGSSVGGRNGVRWYEIGNLAATPTLLQAGTLFDPAAATPFGYWMATVMASGQGHMALGASRASASAANGGFASVVAAGRLRTNAAGATQAATLLQGSTFTYDQPGAAPEAWGRYSHTVVDPTDDQTLWTFQEYTNATNSWAVRAAQLRAPPPVTPAVASPSTVPQNAASVIVVISGTSVGGSEFFDPGADTGGPGFANRIAALIGGGVTVNSITFNSPTQLTLDISTVGAASGPQNVTITNPDGQSATGFGLLTVFACPVITVDPATVPNGTVGSPYAQTFTQSGGVPPVTFGLAGTLPAGLTFDPATATLSGTPTQTGSFSFTVTATDANNCIGSRSYTLVIDCATITVNPATVPNGTAGAPYSQAFTQTGGTGTITWSLAGALPAGLGFDPATGVLSGTPTQTGSFTFTVAATDANGCVGSRDYTLVIDCQAITVDPATVPNGTAGSAYSQVFTQSGGIGAITWALTGTLPAGLSFDPATATLSGTPTQTGSFSFTVTATDANGCIGSRGYTLVVDCQTITVDPATVPNGTAGAPYSQVFTQSGGIGAITWSLTGTLPAGLSFDPATATLSGTPTQTGSFTFTVTATDANGCIGSRGYTLVIDCQTITVDPATVPNGTAGSPYSQVFTQSGGIGTVSWALSGSLPAGLSFDPATATLSGAPTETGSFTFTVTATDANGCIGGRTYTLVVDCQTITVDPATVPTGTAGAPYSQVFTQTGGIGTITWALTGTLPAGLSFDPATATLSGTPTQSGSFSFTVTATDANGCIGSRGYTLVVDCQVITVDPATVPNGTAGAPYSQVFTQSGGIGAITWSLTGTLPAGLSFDPATATLSGTPTETGSFNFTVTATDANGCIGSRAYTLVVDCQTITVDPATVPNGTAGAPYSQVFTQTGGIGAITWSLTGTLPAGLSFDPATATLSGTPTQTGSFSFTVTATDANGCIGSRGYTLVIDCQTITVDPATVPNGTAGSPYSQVFTQSGGIGAISWSLTGTLPAGLSFDPATATLSGTPIETGSFAFTVTATDANGCIGGRTYTLVVDCQTITVDPATVPPGTAGAPYSQVFTQSGGIGAITWSLTGALPAGLSFDPATATLSGTPTESGGFSFTVTATDANGCIGSRGYTLLIDCPTITVDPANVPNGTAGSPYSQVFTQSGGIGAITWSLTGTLPAGLSFDPATATLSGTPTQTGSFSFTVTATDANGCIGSRGYTLVIDCQAITVDPANVPNGTAGSPYSQVFTQTGGIGAITWSLTGTLPAGLSFDPATATLSGTPTQTGSFTFTVTATDANGCVGSRGYLLVIDCQTITVNPATVPNGTAGSPYSQVFTQSGGIGTITWALTGTLPAGLGFNPATATLSGTPTQTGSFNFTVTATDANGCIGSRAYTLVVDCATITVSPATIPSGTAGQTYSQTFTQTGGIAPITWTLTGTLPAGLTFDPATATLSGTPAQLGTFSITVTATDANGCAGGRTYDLVVVPAGPFVPTALEVDQSANRVFEAGETAVVAPTWRNDTGAPQSLTGTASLFTGPGTSTYTIVDGSANYGTVAAGGANNCSTASGDCYSFRVSVPNQRPALHWDSTYRETLSSGDVKTWTLHLGDSFTDMPRASGFYRFVETLLHRSITGGCGEGVYCPGGSTLREQMAVFVLVAKEGPGYVPPACTTPIFNDVPAASPYCRFIEELVRRGVVTGCGGGAYCPQSAVTREQMAVFALRTLDPTLNPPACTTPMFNDVPASSPFCKWIEELARRGVVTGCGGGAYCPTSPVTREQMGVFITVTFGLTLYGP